MTCIPLKTGTLIGALLIASGAVAATPAVPPPVASSGPVGPAASMQDGAAPAARKAERDDRALVLGAAYLKEATTTQVPTQALIDALRTYKATIGKAKGNRTRFAKRISLDQVNVTNDKQAVTDTDTALAQAKAKYPAHGAQVKATQAAQDAAQSQLATDRAQLTTDQTGLENAKKTIADAHATLSAATGTTLSPDVIAKLDATLGV